LIPNENKEKTPATKAASHPAAPFAGRVSRAYRAAALLQMIVGLMLLVTACGE
jgi:hypothetical protein